jgi:ABC-2 type transport system permease protein
MIAAARGVLWRATYTYFHNPAFLVPSLVFPLIFLAAFAGGLSALGGVPGFDFPAGYTAFQYVFVLLQSSALGGVFTGFSVAADFESGFARRLMLAAPDRRGIILGYAGAAVVRFAFTIAVVTVIALVTGMRITGDGVDLFGLYALAALINLVCFLWGCGVAMRFRTIQAGPLMQTPVFIVLFLAPVYVPLDLLNGWIHAVATVNPSTAFLEAGRGLISGAHDHTALAFGCAGALLALLIGWALTSLRAAERAP